MTPPRRPSAPPPQAPRTGRSRPLRAPGRRGSSAPPAALYQRVKAHVRAGIAAGRWRPGDRVPSEHELVAALRVSRMTVHRALREMRDHGELVRVAGVGTFVADSRPQAGLARVTSIADEIRGRGHRYTCDLVHVARETATIEVAAALGLATGAAVFHSVCVHREDGVPVQFEDRYVNPAAAPDFGHQDFSRVPPAEYLLRTVPLDEVEHVVDAVLPGRIEAQRLDIRHDEPCLVLTRRTWSAGVAVTFVRCVHPGSRYRLGSRFRTSGREHALA